MIDKLSIIGLKALKFISVSLASVMLVGGSYMAWDMYHTEKAAFSSYDLTKYRPQVENGEPATLEEVEEINKDSRAWLTIYGTHIDYPVVQGKDDLEYVNKDIYGKTVPTGSIYLAARNASDFSDPYSLIYGHHMDNGAMFGDVDDFLEKDFFDSHQKGILVTPNQVYDLELFAAMKTYAYNSTVYNPVRTGLDIVGFAMANADQTKEVTGVTQVLALSTCDDSRTNGRDVAFFKMTPHEGPWEEYIPDESAPLGIIGGHGDNYWALLNLCCLIVTIYNFIPLHILFSKYRRKKNMKERDGQTEEPKTLKEKISAWAEEIKDTSEDEEGLFNTKKFGRKAFIGFVIEFIIALVALIVFVLTEDMSLPVRIIDKWTPLMLILLFLSWLVDTRLMRINMDAREDIEED